MHCCCKSISTRSNIYFSWLLLIVLICRHKQCPGTATTRFAQGITCLVRCKELYDILFSHMLAWRGHICSWMVASSKINYLILANSKYIHKKDCLKMNFCTQENIFTKKLQFLDAKLKVILYQHLTLFETQASKCTLYTGTCSFIKNCFWLNAICFTILPYMIYFIITVLKSVLSTIFISLTINCY